ncbi:hypothetical protein FXO38_15774 [Capsicum annuum]|nr:hypothetical protein FXO38_15774 [Capsicum annuum]
MYSLIIIGITVVTVVIIGCLVLKKRKSDGLDGFARIKASAAIDADTSYELCCGSIPHRLCVRLVPNYVVDVRTKASGAIDADTFFELCCGSIPHSLCVWLNPNYAIKIFRKSLMNLDKLKKNYKSGCSKKLSAWRKKLKILAKGCLRERMLMKSSQEFQTNYSGLIPDGTFDPNGTVQRERSTYNLNIKNWRNI